MKAHYFYLSQGVTRGPLNKEEVIQLIQNRQLHGLDLVLKETSSGIEDWKAVHEMTEFAASFRDVAAEKEPLDWVVLVRRGKGQYLQNGPFSTKDVRNHLREGRLRYTDYAWKTGMDQWSRMTDLAEFKSKKKSPQIGKIDPLDVDDKEKLPAIPKVSYAKKPSTKYKANPFLADEGEVVDVAEQLPPPKKEVVKKEIEKEEPKVAAEDYLRPFIFEAKKKNYWMVAASLALLIGVIWTIHHENKKRETPINIENKTITKRQEPVLAPAVVPEPKEEPLDKEERKIPTQIGFSAEKDFLLIQSNGSRHYPIKVLVVGLPGELQSGKVWFKSLVTRPEKGNVSISIPELGLVPGNYRIRISTDSGLKIEKELAYASEGKQYLKLRNSNRKDQSYWYSLDRMRLILRVAKLREAVTKLAQQKETDFKFLREKDKVPEKIFYFEWEKYTELKNKATRLSKKSWTDVQRQEVLQLKTEVDNLSQRLGLLSVWR